MCPISVSGKNRNWECLNRKISKGINLETAAEQAGIPLEEVFSYISGKLEEIDTFNFELKLIGKNAIKRGLTKLSKLAADGQRTRGTTDYDDEGKPVRSVTFGPDDLEAAKALAKLGIDALKLSRAKVAEDKKGAEQGDLFDAASDPWKLKKVE